MKFKSNYFLSFYFRLRYGEGPECAVSLKEGGRNATRLRVTNRASWRSRMPSCGTLQAQGTQQMRRTVNTTGSSPAGHVPSRFREGERNKSAAPREGRASTTRAACCAIFQRSACLGKRRRRRRRSESRYASEQKRRPIERTHKGGRRGFEEIEFEEFEVARLLQKFKVLFGLLLCLLTISDRRTKSTGVFSIEGCLKCLSHRSAYGSGEKHPRPSRGLQNHPMCTAEIQRAAKNKQPLESGLH